MKKIVLITTLMLLSLFCSAQLKFKLDYKPLVESKNIMNVKLHVQLYSIVNIIQIVRTLYGNNKDIQRGMVIKNIKQNVTHIK